MLAASHPIPSPDHSHAPKRVASTTLRTIRDSFYSNGTVASLSESLGWFNRRGSKTSQACYSHPRCDLNLARLFRFSLLLPLIGRILFLLNPRGHKTTAPFVYYPCLPCFPHGVYNYFAVSCVFLPLFRMYVCMYVCIFIKLHITAQSGPVILFILCHSH